MEVTSLKVTFFGTSANLSAEVSMNWASSSVAALKLKNRGIALKSQPMYASRVPVVMVVVFMKIECVFKVDMMFSLSRRKDLKLWVTLILPKVSFVRSRSEVGT